MMEEKEKVALVGTLGGAAIGHLVGKGTGYALHARKMRKASLLKKVKHGLKSALSKKYRADYAAGRRLAGKRGADLGRSAGLMAGFGLDTAGAVGRVHASLPSSVAKRKLKKSLRVMGVKPGRFKTKKDLNKYRRDLIRKHHPDMNYGASPRQAARNDAKVKSLNDAWDHIKESDYYTKLAHAWRKSTSRRS